jgi:hypothetical protein
MRRLATALAALAALMLGAPMIAHAQDKPAPITKEQRDKGMKDAPGVVQKLGVNCTVSDAYYIGKSTGADKADIYEVACQQGLGYVLLSSATPKAYDCVATASQKTLACRLPANGDPKQGLKTYISAAGVTCTPTQARYVGANTTTTVYEVACQEGPGYLLEAPAPGAQGAATQGIPCIQAPSNMACTLTSKAQNDAYLAALVSKAQRTCTLSGSRYLGSDKTTGVAYYEVGCGAQAGFVIGANKTGGVDRVLSCGEAQPLGGCQLTSAAQVAAEDTARYTQVAKAAGYNCDVSRDRPIGQDKTGRAIVEIACSNRPDGAVVAIPAAPGARAEVVDCVKAAQYGSNGACSLTQPTTIYDKYTAALAAKGRTTCKVSNARYLGRNSSGTDLVETACADGKPGWVMEITPAYQAVQVFSCGQAKSSGLTCELPTNMKG